MGRCRDVFELLLYELAMFVVGVLVLVSFFGPMWFGIHVLLRPGMFS